MKSIQIISQDLFDKVRSRFTNLEMGDETGAVTIDPSEALFFDFDFVQEGINLGRVSISLNDRGSLKIYYSQGITENQDDESKKIWFSFLKEMRFFAMRRLLRFDTRDIAKNNLDKNDFQHLAKTQSPEEESMNTMNESRWNNKSSKKTSRAVQGKTEVIVRHGHAVDEEYSGSRSQKKNIKAIFIQNSDGERFKYPFIHPAGAFAMAQHVDHGGIPHDAAGKAIIKMSEDLAQLQEFQRKIHKATLHDDATGITERAIGRMNELKSQIAALSKRHHYENWMAEFNEQEHNVDDGLEMDEVTMEQYKQKFTQTSFQEELTGYFPLLHRIMGETSKIDLEDFVGEELTGNQDKLDIDHDGDIDADDLAGLRANKKKSAAEGIDYFSEWAEAVEQGKLTDDQISVLKQAIESLPQGDNGPNLELGPEGQTAWQFFQELGIDDSDLEEKLHDMTNVDPETNALDVFKLWAEKNYPELTVALGMSGAEEPTAPAEPEQPVAEVDDGFPNTMMPKESDDSKSMIKMIAEKVKSFYNADNENVGPFHGNEGILIDIEKECAEKYGPEAGQQARQMAEGFMDKLTHQWEERHGKSSKVGAVDPDDGLARLKELLGNIKTKVEGIGDRGNAGTDFNNNIMSAEDQVNELSKDTLKSYSKEAGHEVYADQRDAEAARDRAYHADQHGEKSNSLNWADEADWLDNRAEKRASGIARATTKIAQKEETAFEAIMRLAGLSDVDGPKK